MTKNAYYILKEEKLILEVYNGEVGFKELMSLKKEIFQDDKYDDSFHFISDFRNAFIFLNKNDLNSFVSFIINHLSFENENKVAVITSTPALTAYFALFVENSIEPKLIKESFNSILQACHWLGVEKKCIGFVEELIAFLSDLNTDISPISFEGKENQYKLN